MVSTGPIGFFDSGVGGLTIWNDLVNALPNEDTIYIADSINAPYGGKTPDEIIDLSVANTQKLVDLGAKLIVVACNTATTQAIQTLRERFDFPFIGIEPAIKPAAERSKSKVIGVLATHGTLESDHFNRTKKNFSQGVEVVTQVGDGLVTAIEKGDLASEELKSILAGHLKELKKHPIDYLVLGCTHYPLLKPLMQSILTDQVEILDSGKAVAAQIKKVLIDNNLKSASKQSGTHQLMSTGDLGILKSIVINNHFDMNRNVNYSSLYQSE
mgnify:CR=1 FL=1|tara:strand:- start:122217 stop:123026 length:810 start_codon:yes stop_codon:yes gene_type:complete